MRWGAEQSTRLALFCRDGDGDERSVGSVILQGAVGEDDLALRRAQAQRAAESLGVALHEGEIYIRQGGQLQPRVGLRGLQYPQLSERVGGVEEKVTNALAALGSGEERRVVRIHDGHRGNRAQPPLDLRLRERPGGGGWRRRRGGDWPAVIADGADCVRKRGRWERPALRTGGRRRERAAKQPPFSEGEVAHD